MSPALYALLGIVIGALGSVVGYFVVGTQRVTEELTKERRTAYAELLMSCDEISGRHQTFAPPELEAAVSRATFLSSNRMFDSGCLHALRDHVGTDEWKADVERFRVLARMESHRNSSLLRWVHQGQYQRSSKRAQASGNG